MEKMLCSKEDREAEEDKSVRVIWEYLCLRHDLTSRHSVIVCLGSNDIRAAQHSAELYHKGLAPWLLFTGGMGTGMHSGANLLSWTEPEAVVFAREAERLGVPSASIIVEDKATNTGENIRFSHGLLEERGIDTTNGLIIVTKPQMGRRAYATFSKQWPTSGQNGQLPPEVKLPPPIVCSSQVAGWPEYIIGSNIERDDLIAILVGDLQRIWKYAFPPTDFQIPQDVPQDVKEAFDILAQKFTANLI